MIYQTRTDRLIERKRRRDNFLLTIAITVTAFALLWGCGIRDRAITKSHSCTSQATNTALCAPERGPR
jgi:hypothetical protein